MDQETLETTPLFNNNDNLKKNKIIEFQNKNILFGMGIFFLFSMVLILINYDIIHLALFTCGLFLGYLLYNSGFGFTKHWRILIRERDSKGFRGHIMLCLLATIFWGFMIYNFEVSGSVKAPGFDVVFGSFIFGIGMQLASACASGSLVWTGAGNTGVWFVMPFFVIGSVLGSKDQPWWSSFTPDLQPVYIPVYINVIILLLILVSTVILQGDFKNKSNDEEEVDQSNTRIYSLKSLFPSNNEISMWVGAILIAIVSTVVLLLSKDPWGITYGITLLGAKIALNLGFQINTWEYWLRPNRYKALVDDNLFANKTAIMDLAIILGAAFGAVSINKFSLKYPTSNNKKNLAIKFLALMLGGLLLGYGSRIAGGCNIGGFVAGVGSSSLHGYVWLLFGMIGCIVGVKLRPIFKID